MSFLRKLPVIFLAILLAGGSVHAQDGKKKKKRNKKNKTEQLANPTNQPINDGVPVISQRDLETAESMFVEGLKYFMLENFEKSLVYFQKSLSINPRNAAVHYKIAEAEIALGNQAAALAPAQKALDLDKTNKYYYLLLTQVHLVQKNYDAATKIMARLVKDVPGTEEYYMQLADLYVAQNKLDDALKSYEKLEKSVGYYDELSFKKQQIYLRQNKLDKAIEEGNKLIEANPTEARYVLAQAQLFASNNKVEEAYTLLNKAVALDPNNPYAQMLLAEMLHQQGKVTEANEQVKAAFRNPSLDIDTKVKVLVEQMRQMNNPEIQSFALELANITIQNHPSEAKAYAVAGDLNSMANKKAEARNNYLKATELDNSHFQIWQQIILIDAELEQTDSLIVHSEKALELFPNQSVFWFYNGTAHLMAGNHKKAARALEQGRKLSIDNLELQAQFSAQLGDAYNSLKDYEKSDAAYEEVLRYDSNNAHVLNNYAYFLSLRNENLEKAKSMSQKLVNKHPKDATYLDTHAWVLYKLKDYQNARKYLEQAIANGNSGTITEHYGDVLFQLGEKDKALEQWQKAKQLGSASDLIDKKIKDKKLYE